MAGNNDDVDDDASFLLFSMNGIAAAAAVDAKEDTSVDTEEAVVVWEEAVELREDRELLLLLRWFMSRSISW